MGPEIYMCYLINTRCSSFRQLARVWNKEIKVFDDTKKFSSIHDKMKDIRKSNTDVSWSNFNIERLLVFINNHIYWEKDELRPKTII